MLAIGTPLGHEYLHGIHEFQDQVHIRALTFDYLYNWARFTVAWADRCEREVQRWDGVTAASDRQERALAQLRRILEEGSSAIAGATRDSWCEFAFDLGDPFAVKRDEFARVGVACASFLIRGKRPGSGATLGVQCVRSQ